MDNGKIIEVGRYNGGGGYSEFSDYNQILDPEGICKAIVRHRGKGTPPLVLIRLKGDKDEGVRANISRDLEG